jgi:hypothetical protein
MCKKSEETSYHLLLQCEVAEELWDMILCLFGMQWVMPRWVVVSLVGKEDLLGTIMQAYGMSFLYFFF